MATALGVVSSGTDMEGLTGVVADEVFIMVAGKPGNGKSTALNNIFGVDLRTSISSCSVTKEIATRRVVKNGVRLTVVDTPGLGAVDIDKKAVTAAMVEMVGGLSYTLLYCLSVAPSCRLTEMDSNIIRNLHMTLGEEVWENCVVLLTFSDTARRDEFGLDSKKDLYIEYVQEVAAEFQCVLRACGSSVTRVNAVFNYDSNTILNRVECQGEIMAIPVGKKVDRVTEPDILPGIVARSEPWTDLVFVEIMRKTREERRRAFVALKYGVQVADSAASAVLVGLGPDVQVATDETTTEPLHVGVAAGTGGAFPMQAILTAIKCSQGHSYALVM